MYILCKKDFNKVNFNFKEGKKYPVTNIGNNWYDFDYPEGEKGIGNNISISYLEENKECLEVINEMSCNHTEREQINNLIICPVCQELEKILK